MIISVGSVCATPKMDFRVSVGIIKLCLFCAIRASIPQIFYFISSSVVEETKLEVVEVFAPIASC